MKLSPHFSLVEMTRSNTAARFGVPNVPTGTALENLKLTASIMEHVREVCGNRPITVSSGFRSSRVNTLVGGSASSDHCKGLAVDFNVSGLSVAQVVALIRNSDVEFDQLIDEFGQWVHIGFGARNRRQILAARKVRGSTVYTVI